VSVVWCCGEFVKNSDVKKGESVGVGVLRGFRKKRTLVPCKVASLDTYFLYGIAVPYKRSILKLELFFF